MSLNSHTTSAGAAPGPSGFRRMSFVMLAARDRADRFEGLPAGSAKPLLLLSAFQEAEPYLGLPPHAFKLVSWLVKQTMPHDWEEGSRPIAWPSARLQAEFLGLSEARVKVLNRILYEAGIFVLRDNEQGKRYGRRGPDKRIIEAYGFDLSPLAYRCEEFIRLAAEARTERGRMKAARARVTIARRAIRQAGELLAELGALPAAWLRLASETKELIEAAGTCTRSDHLELAAKRLESLKAEAEQWVKEASQAGDTDPEGLADKPHSISTTNLSSQKDTVIAAEGRSWGAARPGLDPEAVGPAGSGAAELEESVDFKPFQRVEKLHPGELLVLAPRLKDYLPQRFPDWREIVDTAGSYLRHDLGVSERLWIEACGVMGRQLAAVALAVVSTKPEGYFTRGAGGYFAAMVKRHESGDLNLDRSLWRLRREVWKGAGGLKLRQ